MDNLFEAIKTGNLELVETILNQNMFDINKVTDEDGKTPLYVACENSDLLTIEEIKSRNTHEPNFLGIVELLLDRGANPDEKNYNGNTPLWQASYNGNFEIVELLLSKGANPDERNDNGITPKGIAQRSLNDVNSALNYGGKETQNSFNQNRKKNFGKIVKIFRNEVAPVPLSTVYRGSTQTW